VGTVPLLVLGLILTGLTNALLQVTAFMMIVSLATMTGLTLAIAALALTFGTLYPQFETENAAQIPTSFGGLVFMMATIALLAAVLGALSTAVYNLCALGVGGTAGGRDACDDGLVRRGRRAVHGGHDRSAPDGAAQDGELRVLA